MKREVNLSKAALIQWLKDTTNIPIKQLQELATGVHFCHLLSVYTKGKFSLQKVNHQAKSEVESLHNLRLLNYGMEAAKLQKVIEINLIAKKQFGTLLDFLQWWHQIFKKDGLGKERNLPKDQQVNQTGQSDNLKTRDQKVETMKKTPLSHDQIVQELNELRPEAPKESLMLSEHPPSEKEKENDSQLYPSLDVDVPPSRYMQEVLASYKAQHLTQQQSGRGRDLSEEETPTFSVIKGTVESEKEAVEEPRREQVEDAISNNQLLLTNQPSNTSTSQTVPALFGTRIELPSAIREPRVRTIKSQHKTEDRLQRSKSKECGSRSNKSKTNTRSPGPSTTRVEQSPKGSQGSQLLSSKKCRMI